jgi:predicted KAP-like P-loop ATPase
MMRATGLSSGYYWKIRHGERIPHPIYWNEPPEARCGSHHSGPSVQEPRRREVAMGQFRADRALRNPEGDRLGYADFALAIAQSIGALNPHDGLVLAIYGPWGSGKSTLLNFIEFDLDKATTEVIRFNPWWFSGAEALTRNFLVQLALTLKKRKVLDSRLMKELADLGDELADVGPGRLLGALRRTRSRKLKDISALRSDLRKKLGDRKKPVLVIIDDVDRLMGDEIRQLFGVIKAVADFPYVTYLLAFDRRVVTSALADVQGLGGASRDYLDKIVQVPFELPLPDRVGLRNMLFDSLNGVLETEGHRRFNSDRWRQVFWAGIDELLHTPRDVIRLENTLSVTYPAVAGLVDPVDFIALEVIRLGIPAVYDVIRGSQSQFAGATSGLGVFGGPGDPLGAIRNFHDGWISEMRADPRLGPAIEIVKALFPKVAAAYGAPSPYVGLEDIWRRDLRVASSDVLPTYFRFGVSSGQVSGIELATFLREASSPDVASNRLMELVTAQDPRKAQEFVDRIVDFTGSEELGSQEQNGLLAALFNVGDDLMRLVPAPSGVFEFGIDISMGRLIRRLLEPMDEQRRYEILRRALEEGRALSLAIREVSILAPDEEKTDRESFVSEEHIQELRRLAVERVREGAADGSLADAPQLPRILYRWGEWGDPDEPRTWATSLATNREGLARLLKAFLQDIRVESVGEGGEGTRTVRNVLDPRDLEPFLDPNSIVDASRTLATTATDPRTRLAAETFLRDYDLRQRGEDPREAF